MYNGQLQLQRFDTAQYLNQTEDRRKQRVDDKTRRMKHFQKASNPFRNNSKMCYLHTFTQFQIALL